MKKILAALATSALLVITFASAAGAQDTVVGSVVSDPATVPEAGEYTMTISGSGFIPDTTVVVGPCTGAGDVLVAGVSTDDEISAMLTETLTGFTDNCDLTTIASVDIDADGNFTQEFTATVGDNFVIGAGALDLSQGGGTWIPIVDPAAAAAAAETTELAVTGVQSTTILLMGATLLVLGMVAVAGARRSEI
jgi:hypothetical protein